MSIHPIQSRVADWISSSNPHPITLTWTRTSSNYPIATITQTDYATSTIIASESTTPPSLSDLEYNAFVESLWEHRIHHFLPMILAFAVIGVLTVLGSLVYLAYRFYQTNRASRQRRRQKAEQKREEEGHSSDKPTSPRSTTLSHIIPWLGIQSPNESYYHPQQREPIRFEKSDLRRIIDDTPSTRRPSLATSWLAKLLPTRRHMSLPILLSSSSGGSSPMDNLNIPISSTFVPIQTSSLTLVPRSEIWQDPQRRRGVDEVDMWERKQSGTEILTIAVPEEDEEDEETTQVQSPPTPQQPMWKFTQHHEAYPDSPDSFQDRRFSLPSRRSMEEQQSASHRSSTTTVLNNVPFPSTSANHKLGYNASKVN